MTTPTLGFHSLTTELRDHRLPVEGTVPDWLSGTLIRNGPGRFDVGNRRVNHWFDGLAMLRRYAFEDGQVRYSNRFLRTGAYGAAIQGQLSGQFGTDTRGWRDLLGAAISPGPPEPTDNASVHVARIDGEYVALTEAPSRVAFDPETLETRGRFEFDDDLPEHVAAAHLVDDPVRDELVGFTTQFGLQPRYHLYRLPYGSRTRERIAAVDANGPAYVHDCSVTATHVVIVESPLVLSALRALDPFADGPIDMLEWQPERGTRVLVVDRDTGELVADPTLDPVFTFHHVNAYVDGETVVLDLVEYPDGDIVGSMSLSELDGDDEGFPAVSDARLVRYRIDLRANAVERTPRYDGSVEMPRVARSVVGRHHRYAYGQATGRGGASGLVKVDCETGTAREWWKQGCYVEEPVPVRRPGGDAEDDGVVLATTLETNAERTLLLVFDAATLTLRARVALPHAEPFGFHGRFFENV
ncbi:carotenoid oxygenase family protein [Natronococcus occultus]|uniref:Lignostilbene-alpha,beta-dioxygenase-like enzyme n=1 Tax=Natronococcus occultus SP4 TaxID=694430 RepID=L0K5W8_9EURY|nr:carotenoid oxygenase family protein [Natronococcus occultus]AGB39920.1 lignostilbene-alpha,beta-dioxygenase-like enzyme [Natronococcus occultus SP4]